MTWSKNSSDPTENLWWKFAKNEKISSTEELRFEKVAIIIIEIFQIHAWKN